MSASAGCRHAAALDVPPIKAAYHWERRNAPTGLAAIVAKAPSRSVGFGLA
jgi:hypothetical protein